MQDKITEILETILHGSLHRYKVKNSKAPLPLRRAAEKEEKQSGNKIGAVAVVKSKSDLEKGKGIVVTSVEALQDIKGSHWTPNPLCFLEYTDEKRKYIKGHTEKNLRQINCFVVDIDLKKRKHECSREHILVTCDELGFPVSLLLDTPNGYHVYFILEEPLYISNKDDYMGLKAAKRITENLANLLSDYIPGIDRMCNKFGFFRMPTEDNVLFFNKYQLYSYRSLMSWSEGYDYDRKRSLFSIVKPKVESSKQVEQEWFTKLFNISNIKPKNPLARNNAIFTMSLACYQSDLTKDECYTKMFDFNFNLDLPLSDMEIKNIVKNAYSGRYKAASSKYINELFQLWGDEYEYKSPCDVFRHHKKERVERKRSHYNEWEKDLARYITDQHKNAREPFIWATQKELSEALGIPQSSLNVIIKQSQLILKTVIGKGRGARTGWTTIKLYIQHILTKLNEIKGAYKQYIHSILDDILVITDSPACTLLKIKVNSLLVDIGLIEVEDYGELWKNTS